MPRNLPDFANPPLAEVALSVQFEPLEQLRTAQIGLLWGEFRQRFPVTEEHAPLDSVIERFGVSRTSVLEPRLQMLETPPVPRVWFLNEAGTELIQVQQERFIHNWRRLNRRSKEVYCKNSNGVRNRVDFTARSRVNPDGVLVQGTMDGTDPFAVDR